MKRSVIEFAEKRRDEESDAYQQSGKDQYHNDMLYWVHYLDGAKAQLREIQDNFMIFPKIGNPVFKIVWERDTKAPRYFSTKTRNTSIIDSTYKFFNAFEDKTSVIRVEERPMCNTDLTKMGTFTFLTAEEAQAVIDKYRELNRGSAK